MFNSLEFTPFADNDTKRNQLATNWKSTGN